jgi:hypothetical protein
VIKNPGTCHYDAMASSSARFACISALASIAVVTSARTAHALGPVDVEVGAKVGVGAEYSGSPNPLGFGLGGRAGVVLFDHLYGGVNLMYYFGAGDGSVHTLMYGVEAGWGFKPFDTVTIRPQVGLGNASFGYTSVDQCPLQSQCYGATTNPATDSDHFGRNDLYVEPGVTVLTALGTWFVGGDVNFLVLPGLSDDSGGARVFITLHGQVGVKF